MDEELDDLDFGEEEEEEPPRREAAIGLDEEHRFDYALQRTEQRHRSVNQTKLVDYSTYYFPFHEVSTVVFPEQKQPLVFQQDERELFEKFSSAANDDWFIVLFPGNIAECQTPPFIATVCKVLQTNPSTLALELLGVSRCRVILRNQEKNEVKAQLLPEVELPSILPKVLPKFAYHMTEDDRYSLAARISGYPFEFVRDITKRNVDKCATMLKTMVAEEIVERALSRGLTSFSYFAATQMFSSRKIEYRMLKENSANARIASAANYCKIIAAECNNCHLPIYHHEFILRLSDLNITHVNEHGYVYQITLLSQIRNYDEVSRPSYEFTWFPGYSWTIITCSQCSHHIGWKYRSQEETPNLFYGIRREAVSYWRGEDRESDNEASED